MRKGIDWKAEVLLQLRTEVVWTIRFWGDYVVVGLADVRKADRQPGLPAKYVYDNKRVRLFAIRGIQRPVEFPAELFIPADSRSTP
jgi:hypothetical protein